MHGCGRGSGAPLNNKNAFKDGWYSKASIAGDREVKAMIAKARATNDELDPGPD